jgi:hypothetical protein
MKPLQMHMLSSHPAFPNCAAEKSRSCVWTEVRLLRSDRKIEWTDSVSTDAGPDCLERARGNAARGLPPGQGCPAARHGSAQMSGASDLPRIRL